MENRGYIARRLGLSMTAENKKTLFKKLRGIIFLTSIATLILVPVTSGKTAANLSLAYSKASKRYHQLIKEKPKLRHKWLACSKSFEKIYKDKKSSPGLAAKSIFTSANIYFELHKLSYASRDLKESKRIYRLFVKKYPKHRLADDSLYRIGEILLKEGNKKGARETFKSLLKIYPKGDMHKKASIRIKELSYITSTTIGAHTTAKKKRKVSKKKKRLVIIDAGHGGKDSGAVGARGILEKNVVLDIALRLKKLLEKNGRYKVIMTRKRDRFISLKNRTKIANKNGSAIFISIHANASKNKKLYGIETFFQGLPKSTAAKETAARENMVFINKKLSSRDNMLRFILSDMKNTYLINESSHLAEMIQSNLIKGMRKKYSRIKDLGVKQALFFVLNDAQIPSVLVEVSFLTNKYEGKRLASRKYRADIASSIYKGINTYTSKN